MENKKLVQLIIPFGVAIILIGITFFFPNSSRFWEMKAYDLKMQQTAGLKPQDRAIADRIKIINVTDKTIKKMGWPNKSDHARMIDILSQHKAALIAYDWIFLESDENLVRATRDSARTLWPVLFDLGRDNANVSYPADTIALLEKSSIPQAQPYPTLFHTTSITISHPSILENALGIGHISARNEIGNPLNDGIFRKVALVVDFAGRAFPSLSLEAVCNYLHVPLEKIKIIPGREIILAQGVFPDTGTVKDIHIPINEAGEMWIYFPGRWEENYFEPFWFENMLDKHFDISRWPEYDRKFKDSICFVGNASGKSKDTLIIPMEDNFPGVGIHASALFTILSGNFIGFTGMYIDALIMLALALAVGLISSRKPPLPASGFHLLLLVGYMAFTFWAFGVHRYNLPTIFPALAILMGGIASLVYHFAAEQREKESLLAEYNEVNSRLQQKDRDLRSLFLKHEETKLQSEKKLQLLAQIKREREDLISKKKGLERRLAEIKDISIQPVREYVPLEKEWEQLRQESLEAGIITNNKRMLEIFRRVKKAARAESPVLILGEMGTGKELIARAIHRLSGKGEFVVVPTIQDNLVESELFGYVKGAFTGAEKDKEGFFAKARGGTIFLDEIGEIPPGIQVKLLGVLSRGEYTPVGSTSTRKTDARVVTATNRNLKKAMKTGNFREDLFYRLNVIPIELPPLRERREDIEILADYFIYSQKQNKHIQGLSKKAMEVLMAHDWPGNIRELENIIERSVALTDGELITEADLEITATDSGYHSLSGTDDTSRTCSPDHLPDISGDNAFLALLDQNRFEIGKTAQALGLNRNTVTERFKGLSLKAMAQNDWDVNLAADSITHNKGNLELVTAKIKEYYNNALEELHNYSSHDELQQQLGKKFKNTPKKFHKYILQMYDEKVPADHNLAETEDAARE